MRAERIREVAGELAHEFKHDFTGFMMDMGKDITNSLKDWPQDELNFILMLINTSLVAMWLEVELAHFEHETAEDILNSIYKQAKQAIPIIRKEYLKMTGGSCNCNDV